LCVDILNDKWYYFVPQHFTLYNINIYIGLCIRCYRALIVDILIKSFVITVTKTFEIKTGSIAEPKCATHRLCAITEQVLLNLIEINQLLH
jgi:hypothetical protein